jgi:hypothetical protein
MRIGDVKCVLKEVDYYCVKGVAWFDHSLDEVSSIRINKSNSNARR